jgi:hypothetical protein
MNGTPESSKADLKKAKTLRLIRKVWMVLVPLFAAIILWRLYNYSNGNDSLSGILSPLGMLLIGIASLLGERYKIQKSILFGLALVLVITALVLLFVN